MLWKGDQSPRVTRETKHTLRGKWESVFSGRHMNNVQKETYVVSVMTDKHKETCAVVTDKKDDRLLWHPIRRSRLTKGEKSSKHLATERKALQTKGARFRAVTKTVKTRHVNCGILPCVKTSSLRPDAFLEENVYSDMLRLRRSPARSQRKVVRKDQLHDHRNLHNWSVSLKFLIRESVFHVKKQNWDQNTPSNSSKARDTTSKFGNEGSIARSYSKARTLKTAIRALPDLRKEHETKPCSKKDAPAEQHGIWRKIFTSSRMRTKLRIILQLKQGCCQHPLRKVQRSENS